VEPLEQRLQVGFWRSHDLEHLIDLFDENRAKRLLLCWLQPSVVEKRCEASHECRAEHGGSFSAGPDLSGMEDEGPIEPMFLLLEANAQSLYLRDRTVERAFLLAERSFSRPADR